MLLHNSKHQYHGQYFVTLTHHRSFILYLESFIGHQFPGDHVTTSSAVIHLALLARKCGELLVCGFLRSMLMVTGNSLVVNLGGIWITKSAVARHAMIYHHRDNVLLQDLALTAMFATASATGLGNANVAHHLGVLLDRFSTLKPVNVTVLLVARRTV